MTLFRFSAGAKKILGSYTNDIKVLEVDLEGWFFSKCPFNVNINVNVVSILRANGLGPMRLTT
jgi:hypothetical protein